MKRKRETELLAGVMRKVLKSIDEPGGYGGTTYDFDDDCLAGDPAPRFYVETGVRITEDELEAISRVRAA